MKEKLYPVFTEGRAHHQPIPGKPVTVHRRAEQAPSTLQQVRLKVKVQLTDCLDRHPGTLDRALTAHPKAHR